MAWCVLGFLPEPDVVLAEVRRVLRPGGRLGVDVYTVRDRRRYRPEETVMPHVVEEGAWQARFAAAGLGLCLRRDLTEEYARAYGSLRRELEARRPELERAFGPGLTDEALAGFGRNIRAVLEGGKGGCRFVVERPGPA